MIYKNNIITFCFVFLLFRVLGVSSPIVSSPQSFLPICRKQNPITIKGIK